MFKLPEFGNFRISSQNIKLWQRRNFEMPVKILSDDFAMIVVETRHELHLFAEKLVSLCLLRHTFHLNASLRY